MAKDGTNRGGARIGAGAKKKPLADKIAEGNPGKRTLTVIDFDNKAVDLEGQQMPKPSKLLSATQKDGKPLLVSAALKPWVIFSTLLQDRPAASMVLDLMVESACMLRKRTALGALPAMQMTREQLLLNAPATPLNLTL